VRTNASRSDGLRILDGTGLTLSGYLQAQYESSQLSEDQIQQGGVPYNRDRFLVRRGRLRLDGAWRWASFALELDANTVQGPQIGIWRAEASFVWRNPRPGSVPYLMATVGVTDIPFGQEIPVGARQRLFMERSLASTALFRGGRDLGLRLSGGVGFVRYALAVMNGNPLDDRAGGPASDPTLAKDIVGRVGFDAAPSDRVQVTGGTSFLTGTGLHAGSDATPGSVLWRDLNENSAVDSGELTAIPGRAATPSVTFRYWAVNVDLGVRVRTRLGWSQLYGEVTLANNLDRGVFPADPIAAGADIRHLGFNVAFTQEITRWAVAGFRYDYYDGNSDFLVTQQGRFVPASLVVQTLSPVVGAVLGSHARVLFQYDAIFDSLGRDARGVPTDLANNQWTLRAQVEY
jgi:hypothetical protein